MATEPFDPSAQLWQAWASGRLCLQACRACGEIQHPPGQVCSHCHATDWDLVDINPVVTLVSWSTVHRAPAPHFADALPYTIVLVSVGPRALLEARLDSRVPVESLVSGMPVRLAFDDVVGRAMPTVVAP
jgi:uncharacterized OB-fold protein